jgi:Cu(I)/Ag(I) efflux system membrane fusion protein
MKKTLVTVGISLLTGFTLGYFVFRQSGGEGHDHSGDSSQATNGGDSAVAADDVWTCSMHPQVKAPKPGLCPICAMDLIPLSAMGGGDGERSFLMSEAAKALAGITTVEVVRENPEAELQLYGKIVYDETSMRSVAARFPARIDRLFVDYTGIRVGKGDHLAVVYSPDLLSAQTELLTAKKFGNANATEVARDKLRLWGFSDDQISDIESSGEASDQLEIDAPVSGIVTHKNVNEGDYVETGTPFFRIADLEEVWVMLDAYESDTPWLRFGQDVSFTTESIPGKTFEGKVSFISPELDPATRTVSVRVNVSNEENLLKPGMFVSGIVKATVAGAGRVLDPSLAGKWISPMHPEIVKDGPGQCDVCGMDLVPAEELGYVAATDQQKAPMVIPTSAVLHTGKRSIVYVELPDKEQPTYEGRGILIGPRAGDRYIVEAGLKPGEKVVAEGGFVIDSALQIQAKKSMMLPGDEEGDRLFPSAPASDEFLTAIDDLLDSYFAIQTALADDSFAAAQTATEQLGKKLAEMPVETIPPASQQVWSDLAKQLTANVGAIRSEKAIAPVRAQFQKTSALADELVRRFGTAHLPVYEHHCPMAFDDTGASWLQPNEDLLNPYFGSEMLMCGSVRGQIVPAKAQTLVAEANAALQSTVGAYLELQQNLANDDFGAAKLSLTKLLEAAKQLEDVETLGALVAERTEVAARREDIEALRIEFKKITARTVTLIRRYGGGLQTELFVAHCPMAMNDNGADWLQTSEEIRNPYFGASMLMCGEIKEQLVMAGEEAGKESE